nr:AraC family transcriptional regulator [Sphingobium sp.]
MDVLSEILALSHVSSSVLSEIDCRGDWAIDMLDKSVAATSQWHAMPFHYVLDGEAYLRHGETHSLLHAGDLIVAPGWPPHAIVSHPKSVAIAITDLISANGLEVWDGSTISRPVTFVAGDGKSVTRLLSGVFTIKGHAADMLMSQFPPLMKLSVGDDTIDEQFATALSFMHQEGQKERPGYVAVAERMTDLLFIQIIRSCTSIAEMQSGLFAALADKSIARALKAIHEDPSVPWTVSSLAKKAGLSRTVFAKRFHTLVGVTPIQYLTRWRLIVAEDMLLRSDLPVGEIQARLGFSSSFAFSRAFRFAFG